MRVRVRVSVGARVLVTSTLRIEPGQPESMLNLLAVLVDHAPDSVWLKAMALLNVPCILVTLLTSHPDKSQLKAVAPENVRLMVVTLPTLHFERSSLNSA